jgi:hypothetical protein
MLPEEIISKILDIRHFGYPKIQIWVPGNSFYSILMLLTVKKEVNHGQKEQIRALIMYVIISNSRRTLTLNEQSQYRNSYAL